MKPRNEVGKKSAGYVLRFEKQRVVIIGHKTWDICACDEGTPSGCRSVTL